MLTKLLKKETCAACRICCVYDDSDVWDAPGFTPEEFERNAIDGRFDWYEKDGLFFLKMDKQNDGLYHCPCLSDSGCVLGDKKPFRCAIWPLYVVRTGESLGLAVSDVCPQVFAIDNERILEGIHERRSEIFEMVQKYPEQIEEFKDNYRMVEVLKEGTYEAKSDAS